MKVSMRMVPSAYLYLLVLISSSIAAPIWGANVPTLEQFLASSQYASVQISPGGEYIAASIHRGNSGIFRVLNRSDYSVKTSFNMGEDRRVASFLWLDDDSVVITGARRHEHTNSFYPTGNSERLNIKTGKFTAMPGAFILSLWRDNPDHVLVAGYSNRYTEVDKMNIKNGRRIKIARSASPRAAFVVNRKHEVVFSIGQSVEAETEVHFREGRGKWQLVNTIPFAAKGWTPIGWGYQEDTYFTRDHRGAKTNGIGLYNAKSAEHSLVFRHPVVDAGTLMTDYHGNLVGVRIDHHYPQYVYVLKQHPMAQAHQALSKQFPNELVTITSQTKDSKAMVVLVSGDRNPGTYYLADLEKGKLDLIGARFPNLRKEQLAQTHGVEIQTRDGETIYGYLTNKEGTPSPGPLLVHVHGGPFGVREYWGYNPTRQLYATRGYHVLQVNFRGSGGYGLDYQKKGFKQWGRLMQDDLTDATKWAIKEGIADPDRICIMGTSYGAYAAMMGSAVEPDLYQCAVALSGIYDLEATLRAGDVRSTLAGIKQMEETMDVGNPEAAAAASPVNHADKIKTSVLMVHGGRDRRTPPLHARRMKSALEEAGNPPEWVFDPNQGHGFSGNRTRRELFQTILDFLDRKIGSASAS